LSATRHCKADQPVIVPSLKPHDFYRPAVDEFDLVGVTITEQDGWSLRIIPNSPTEERN
jgi:hypothetical protein